MLPSPNPIHLVLDNSRSRVLLPAAFVESLGIFAGLASNRTSAEVTPVVLSATVRGTVHPILAVEGAGLDRSICQRGAV